LMLTSSPSLIDGRALCNSRRKSSAADAAAAVAMSAEREAAEKCRPTKFQPVLRLEVQDLCA